MQLMITNNTGAIVNNLLYITFVHSSRSIFVMNKELYNVNTFAFHLPKTSPRLFLLSLKNSERRQLVHWVFMLSIIHQDIIFNQPEHFTNLFIKSVKVSHGLDWWGCD
jgi:predicted Kef-type K+ transport protein